MQATRQLLLGNTFRWLMAVVGFEPSCLQWRLYQSLEPSCAKSKEGLVQAVFTSCNWELQCGEGSFVMIGSDGVRAAVLVSARVESSPSHLCTAWNWVIGDIFIFCDMPVNYLSP